MRRIVSTSRSWPLPRWSSSGQAASGSGSSYEVRAIFDNGASWSPASGYGSPAPTSGRVGLRRRDAAGRLGCNRVGDAKSSTCDDPGKAVVVLKIDDPASRTSARTPAA